MNIRFSILLSCEWFKNVNFVFSSPQLCINFNYHSFIVTSFRKITPKKGGKKKKQKQRANYNRKTVKKKRKWNKRIDYNYREKWDEGIWKINCLSERTKKKMTKYPAKFNCLFIYCDIQIRSWIFCFVFGPRFMALLINEFQRANASM